MISTLNILITQPILILSLPYRKEVSSHLLDKAREENSAAEVSIITDLHEAYQVLSTDFVEATTIRVDILPGAQRAFDAVREGYREGKFGYLDVLDAQRSLFDAQGQYIDALAGYHRSVANIERLIGKGLLSVNVNVKQNEKEL